ncbi:Hypothetical predicted protein [Argonauta hians]
MATGGSPSKGSSSDSHARSGWQSTSDDAVSMNSIQNELRPNNLEVSEWKESSIESTNKRRKKGNRERERERGQSLMQDLPSPTERRQHTPSSYSRTKLPPNAELSERMELENLKQHFSFEDYELSSDDEKNNEKTVTFNRRDIPPNYTRQDTSSTNSEHHRHSDSESRKNKKTNAKNRNRVGETRYQSEESEEKEKNDEKRSVQNNVSQDRTQEAITDSNQIVARMMQIKDYRKQIKLMIDTLQESDDPTDHRKISKLTQVLNSLEEQEHSYMEILQKLWIIRKKALLNADSNANQTSKDESGDDSDTDDSETSDRELQTFEPGTVEKSEDLTSIEQQQILLRQIMEQKEQLKKLQERQTALLAIEKDAVQKLAEARERQRLLQEPMDNTAPPEFALNQRDNQPAENTIGDDMEEHRKMQNNLPSLNPQSDDNLMTVDLENLAFDTTDFEDKICLGRLSLQNKLKHLQEKRRCVNELLRYVKSLRAQSTEEMPQINNNTENTENSVQISESVTEKTDLPVDELPAFPEANEKWEELLGVRERLNHLRSLFREYQVCTSEENTGVKDLLPIEDGEKTQNSQQGKSSSCEASDKYSDTNHIQNLSDDYEEDFNPELGSLMNQPGVRDKLNELQEAKDRLRHLQQLINKLNDSSEGASEQTAEELALVLAESDNPNINKKNSRSSTLPEPSASGGAFPQANQEALIPLQNKSAKLKMKMQEQQIEVDRLKEQRERLLTFHQQLLNFHDSLPSWSDELEKCDRDKTNEVTFAPEPEIQDFNQMTYSSNDELYHKMRKERIQREELRQRKKEMEDLMHKDKPKRNYSRNQDNQSDSVSYSTDFLGANTSADVTMATWGGSTADNFENINEGCDKDDDDDDDDDDDEEEGEGDDDEEREDINEEDDYLSDVIRDAEEGGESSSKETYTIEKDARRHVKQSQASLLDCMPLDSRGGFPSGKRNKYCCQRADSKGGSPSNHKQYGRPNSGFARKQENIRAPEYIIQEDEHDGSLHSENSPLNLLERQMDKMANTYQELLMEQQQLRYQLHSMRYQNSNGFAFDPNQASNMYWQPNPFASPEVQNPASQQQILLALSQCFQQLSVQQSEMNNLQRQVHSLVLQSRPDSAFSNSHFQNSFATGINQWKKPKHFCWDSNPQNSYLCGNRFYSSSLKPDAIQKTKTKGNNNVLSSTVPSTKSRKRTNSSDKNYRRRFFNKQYCDKDNAEKCPKGCSQTCSYFWNFSNTNKDVVIDAPTKTKKLSASARQKHSANFSSKSMAAEDSKRKLNPSQNTIEFKHDVANTCTHKPPSNNSNSKKIKNESSLWLNKTTADLVRHHESDTVKRESIPNQQESNSFDCLKSDIYAEVAKLISQNEKHPKYMISLFQKLQCFDSISKRENIMNIIESLIERARLSEAVFSFKSEEFPHPSATSNRISINSDNAKRHEALKKKNIHESSDDSGSEGMDLSAAIPGLDIHFANDSLGETAINLKKVLSQVAKQKAGGGEKLINRELGHSNHSAVDQGSESSVSDMFVAQRGNPSVSEIIKEISKQLIPIINLHKDETFTELLINDVLQKIVTLLHEYISEQDINYKHFSSNLYNNLIEFKSQTVEDCFQALLKKVSDVLNNELSYLRLIEDLGENALSKSLLEKLALLNQDTNNSRVSADDSDTTLGGTSTTQLLADGDLSTRDSLISCKKSPDNAETGINQKNSMEHVQGIPNGFPSTSSKNRQDQGVPMEIELAVSETKPFSKIGSDEDDEDDDESHNAEDPSVTAVSLETEKENHCLPERGDGDIPTKMKYCGAEIPGKANGLLPKSPNDKKHSPQSSPVEHVMAAANDQLQVEDLPNVLESLSNDHLDDIINEEFPPGAAFFENLEKNELAGDSEALPCNKLNSQFDAASDS